MYSLVCQNARNKECKNSGSKFGVFLFFVNCTKWNVLNKARECNKGSERSETQVNSVTVAVNVVEWG